MTARDICPPNHRHGEVRTCYALHRCGCDECREAATASENRRGRLMAYGRYDSGLVDAAPVREHLETLQKFGIGYMRVARVAGVSKTATRSLVYGREDYVHGVKGPRHGEVKKRIKREVAERILAVEPTLDLLGKRVAFPAVGTHRRIQALMCLGWSMTKIGALIGADETSISRTLRETHVGAGRARDIVALYDGLWNSAPDAVTKWEKIAVSRSKRYAAEHGFIPPMGWDDIDTDPEPPTPDLYDGADEVLIQEALTGARVKLSPAERRVAVARLWERRYSDARTAQTLHISARTVLRIRQELDLAAFDFTDLEQAS